MQIKQLEYFWEAAKYDSLNQASEKLFISHQALSATIKALEKELGFELFNRTLQGISLTPEGQNILEDVEQMLNTYYKWKNLYNESKTTLRGEVLVAAPPAICSSIVSKIIVEFAQLYPQIDIILYEGRDLELFDYISKGKANIIIDGYSEKTEKTLAYSISKKHKLILDEVYTDSYHVYLNSRNPLAQKEYLVKSDLQNLSLATYPNREYYCSYSEIYNYFNQKFYSIMHQETIFKLIVANENVAALFPKILSFNSIYCQNKDVIPLAIFDEKIAVTNFILHNPKSRMSLAEQLVVNKIKEIFASLI